MGIFNFLKKDKADTTAIGMELPPIPNIDEPGGYDTFPEINDEKVPPLPDNSLPPLPTEFPGAVPPKPEDEMLNSPRMELPTPPGMDDMMIPAEPKKVEKAIPDRLESEKPEMPEFPDPSSYAQDIEEQELPLPEKTDQNFPSMHEMQSDEFIPDKIPPLEGIPEAPEFKSEKRVMPQNEYVQNMDRPSPKPMIRPAMPPSYFAPEEPVHARREVRGPMFIRTDRFKAILDDIEQIRATFKQEDDTFFRINDVKSSQDQKFEEFRQSLEDIQRKLLFIDRSLFEATTRS